MRRRWRMSAAKKKWPSCLEGQSQLGAIEKKSDAMTMVLLSPKTNANRDLITVCIHRMRASTHAYGNDSCWPKPDIKRFLNALKKSLW